MQAEHKGCSMRQKRNINKGSMSEPGVHGSEDRDTCIASTRGANVLLHLLDETLKSRVKDC